MDLLVLSIVIFFGVGIFFLFFHLMLGKLVRPARPEPDKLTIYECGEPTVGSAWIQFDLRYYVVALLFVIFDVEVAFFFPWAVVFGKTNELARLPGSEQQLNVVVKKLTLVEAQLSRGDLGEREEEKLLAEKKKLTAEKVNMETEIKANLRQRAAITRELVPAALSLDKSEPEPIDADTAKNWSMVAFLDILVFFGVLLVGFAYLWKRGDINWVRSTAAERLAAPVLVELPARPSPAVLAGTEQH